MAFEYKPGTYDKPFNQWRCRAAVYDHGSRHARQCSRRPVNDGWCKQHHPDVEAARREAALERSHRKFENTPLIRCQEKLKKVTAQRDALLAALKAVEWIEDDEGWRDGSCPWCQAGETAGHHETCQRQAAIAQVKGEQ